ncbi:MAG: Gfo/Idh/MocA family oxidoreductase [Bacillota bacterium]|nr:Gfo/Idh/MocA family oxidoreductase [Bacillota bacterium]
MDKIKVGIIGLGARGTYMITNLLADLEDLDIVAVSDLYDFKIEDNLRRLKAKGIEPWATKNYLDILEDKEIEVVFIFASWEAHIKLACEAMEHGKAVGLEVGGAYSINDCFKLVETQERTGTFFMMLENCCYGRDEMLVMNMVRQGLFGDVVHCRGGYRHDLRNSIARGEDENYKHYRQRNYLNRNCDNYPTHALGPIAKILDINRGNRIVSVISQSSSSKGMHEYIKNNPERDQELLKRDFALGDVVNTILKCAHGETISLTLGTTLPGYYSRNFEVRGTKGSYVEENKSIFLESDHGGKGYEDNWTPHFNNASDYYEKYDHPLWKKTLQEGLKGGHGGMDGMVIGAFIEAYKKGLPSPIDVYDAATWMAVTVLSEESIAKGGAPAFMPDFTGGAWVIKKREESESLYAI